MCGLNFTTGDGIEHMNRALAHRGLPGRTGVLETAYGNFGHVRLPIQGLSTKWDQPYQHNGRVYCFVGEIFNYKELLPGSESDLEVLIHFWELEGIDAFLRFDGFWSVIIQEKEKLFVITDYLAKKPLYIRPFGSLAISSNIEPLIRVGDELDQMYFSSVGKWGYTNTRRTPFKEIKKIDPDSCVIFNLEEGTIDQMNFVSIRPAKGEKLNLRSRIRTAVKNRLVSDIPVSVLVSGGIDSSIIYREVVCFTHDFTVFHIDNGEEEYLDMLNIPSGIPVIKLPKPTHSNTDYLREVLYFNEGPVDLGSMLPQYDMAKSIKEHGFNVVITGDGADELFGGYRRMLEYDAQYSDIFEELVYYHLPRLDKLSMAHTVELRSPFLAKSIIEFALSLPYKERVEKKYLKEIYRGLLPEAIINRKKHALKSDPVLNDPQWRHTLIKLYKELAHEHYGCRITN